MTRALKRCGFCKQDRQELGLLLLREIGYGLQVPQPHCVPI